MLIALEAVDGIAAEVYFYESGTQAGIT